MATDLAPAPVAPPRRVWQLPTFVAGLAAVYAAVTLVPPPGERPTSSRPASAGELKSLLDRKPIDPAAVAAAIKSLADDPSPKAAFLVGTGYMALAEAGDADQWKPAADALAKVTADGLDAADRPKLAFRAAKAQAAAGTGDPAAILSAFATPPAGEDRSELPRLAAEVALRSTPPDLKRARDELTHYLGGAHKQPAAAAARLKLTLAELNTTLGQPDKARVWLKDIGAAAPADVLAVAKMQLGRIAVGETNWADAVTQFEAAIASGGLPAAQAVEARYHAGHALAQMRKPEQAVAFLEQAARDGGPAASAAAVRLAEMSVRGPAGKGDRSAAAGWLARVAGPTPLVPTADVRAAFEEVIQVCKAEGDFASGVKAAAAYASVAENGKDKELRAELNAAWAAALPPAEAAAKHAAAAADYAALADTFPTAAGKADLLRRAATGYRQAGDSANALASVEKLLALPDAPADAVGYGWVEKADLLPPTDYAAVKAALEKALAAPGPAAGVARFRLAMLHVNRGSQLAAAGASPAARQEADGMAKLGRELLAQMADAATVPPAERAAHEEAVFELGRLHMAAGQYPDAVARFRTQLRLYPSGPKGGHGRLWLACCLVQQAATDTPFTPADPRLTEALSLLDPLQTSTDPFLKAQAEIRGLNTLFVMRKFDDVAKKGTAAMDAFRGKPEELVAGELVFHAHLANSPADAAAAGGTLNRMDAVYKTLAKDAFPADPNYSFESWQKKLPALRGTLQQSGGVK